jgi:hypothetical protein
MLGKHGQGSIIGSGQVLLRVVVDRADATASWLASQLASAGAAASVEAAAVELLLLNSCSSMRASNWSTAAKTNGQLPMALRVALLLNSLVTHAGIHVYTLQLALLFLWELILWPICVVNSQRSNFVASWHLQQHVQHAGRCQQVWWQMQSDVRRQ